MNRVGERKTRSDKKKDVKPLVKTEVKESIQRISHITFMPIKDVCEFLTVYAANDRVTLDKLTKFIKRSVRIGNTFYNGDSEAQPITKRFSDSREKVTIKFKRDDFERISTLAYAMDCTPTRATAIFLTQGVRNVGAVNAFVRKYLAEELSPRQVEELRQILTYTHRYDNDNHSWASVLSAIVGDVRPAMRSLREIVDEFIWEHKR